MTRDNDRRGDSLATRTGAWPWFLIALALAGLAALLVVWWLSDDSAGPNVGVTVDDVTNAPRAYVGQTVTVSGEVDNIVSERAVTIGGGLFDDSLLVLSSGATEPVGNRVESFVLSDVIQVTGPVGLFDTAEVENELGIDLDDALLADHEGEPYVRAESLDFVVLAYGFDTEPLTANQFTSDAIDFIGEPLVVGGVVTEMVGDNALVLDNVLLVIGRDPLAQLPGAPEAIDVGGSVWVEGQGARLNFDEIGDQVSYELDRGLFDRWEGTPVVIAEEIIPGD